MTTVTQTTASPESPEAPPLAVNPDGIPEVLRRRWQWVVWKLEKRKGEVTKVPYSPWDLTRASSTDLTTWASFEGAMIMYQKHDFDGVGFVFSSGDPFVGVDLDACRDRETGEIEEWAQEIIDGF